MAGFIGIGGLSRPLPAAGARGAPRPGGGFRLPPGASPSGEAAATLATAPLAALTLQEEAEDAAARDRRGAARARDLLKELADLQAEMLGGPARPDRLARLAGLADGEAPADPVLADALAGIALRAKVELARRGIMVATG